MCMSSKAPKPKAPPPPPTERDANLEGLRERQRAAGVGAASGPQSTILTGSEGLPDAAPGTGKRVTLGGA